MTRRYRNKASPSDWARAVSERLYKRFAVGFFIWLEPNTNGQVSCIFWKELVCRQSKHVIKQVGRQRKTEIVWPSKISGSASPLESVMPDAKADNSVNMVIMRSMSAKWSNERHVRQLQGKGLHFGMHQWFTLNFLTLTSVCLQPCSPADKGGAPAWRWIVDNKTFICLICRWSLIFPNFCHRDHRLIGAYRKYTKYQLNWSIRGIYSIDYVQLHLCAHCVAYMLRVKQVDITTGSMSLNVLIHRSNMAALVSSHIPACLELWVVHDRRGTAGHWGEEENLKWVDKGQSVTLFCFVTLTLFDMDSLPEQITITSPSTSRVQHAHASWPLFNIEYSDIFTWSSCWEKCLINPL